MVEVKNLGSDTRIISVVGGNQGHAACKIPLLHEVSFLFEVKTLGPTHVLYLWLGVIKVMLRVRYFCSMKPPFCLR